MSQYIVYNIKDKTGRALIVGALSCLNPGNVNKFKATIPASKQFCEMEYVETKEDAIKAISLFKYLNPHVKCKPVRPPVVDRKTPKTYKRKEDSILKERTIHRKALAKFKDEHQPGDKNGYLLYVLTTEGRHQIIKI